MNEKETSKEQILEELKLGEQQCKAVIENVPDYVLKLDLDGKIMFVNRLAPGTKEKDIIGKYVFDLGSDKHKKIVKKALEQALNTGKVVMFETPEVILPSNSEYSIFLNRLVPIVKNDRIENFLQISTDITECSRAKDMLCREKDFSNTLIQSSAVFFVAISSKGKIILMNNFMLKAVGYKTEEVIGKDYMKTFVSETHRKAYFSIFKTLTVSHVVTIEENHVMAKNGSEMLVEWHGVPIFDENNEFDYFFGVGLDITLRRKEENELKKLKEQLEVEVITKAQKLVDVQDKAIRFEKLAILGKLAGMVAHEIRTPLGVIKNSVYFLKNKLGTLLEDEKIKNHLDIINAEVCISDSIIEDILTFAKIKEPKLTYCKVSDILEEAIKKVMVPPNIEIVADIQRGLSEILVDEDHLVRVFVNLITNAVQAMPEGGKVTIKCARSDKFIEIDIKDTGEGIPKMNLKTIFEPLFTTKIRGTGLGLSVCQSIIALHKGIITAESEEGEGTKIIVKLPVNEE